MTLEQPVTMRFQHSQSRLRPAVSDPADEPYVPMEDIMEWVSGQFPGFLLASTDSGNCWSVLRNSQTLSDLALQQSATCGFEIGNWVCLNRAFANSWTREQTHLSWRSLSDWCLTYPEAFYSGQSLDKT